jgi:hypothetical protein
MEVTMLEKMKSKFQEYEFPFSESLQFIFSRNLLGLKQAYTVCLSMDAGTDFFGVANSCQPAAT